MSVHPCEAADRCVRSRTCPFHWSCSMVPVTVNEVQDFIDTHIRDNPEFGQVYSEVTAYLDGSGPWPPSMTAMGWTEQRAAQALTDAREARS